MKPQAGDKIAVRATKERGIVISVHGDKLRISLSTGETLMVQESELTNFSAAARKAWQKMPKRRVGRPKGTATSDRVSVTLRISRDTWERFQAAESAGKIVDRTATVNEWIREKLDEIDK
ncbi:hypothetical protein CGZ80_14625 [Rhodopirellula sp. MGV]|nr:hypothetical protein CGZ80_14625 [Rhodopirellula sp. MGV]PNY36898.1 hypothetical protein C2E31_10590 [Rhodopirellula baltica]PNY37238.1 hypothetical protein C2E31_08745 [Rhodopirellula baltica]